MNAFELTVVADAEALADAALEHVVAAVGSDALGSFRLALAGGSTPKRLYTRLAADSRMNWSAVELFFGDERVVPKDHDQSNFRMVREALLDRVPIPASRVHRIRTELGAAAAAAAYAPLVSEPLDLVLLGMGSDGHTASIFPNTEHTDGVVVTTSPVPPTERVSLGIDVINRARAALLLVSGEGKAKRLAEVFAQREAEEVGGEALPAARVNPTELRWLVDEAAARWLPQER